MMLLPVIIAAGLALCLLMIASSRPAGRVGDYEMMQTIRECELQYGEICHLCEAYIGDATGEARICGECRECQKKETREKKILSIFDLAEKQNPHVRKKATDSRGNRLP